MQPLENRSAIVTGASRGIGAAVARALAAHGAKVLLLARSADEIDKIAAEIESMDSKAIAMRCDVTNYEDVEAAVSGCRTKFGSVDILIKENVFPCTIGNPIFLCKFARLVFVTINNCG